MHDVKADILRKDLLHLLDFSASDFGDTALMEKFAKHEDISSSYLSQIVPVNSEVFLELVWLVIVKEHELSEFLIMPKNGASAVFKILSKASLEIDPNGIVLEVRNELRRQGLLVGARLDKESKEKYLLGKFPAILKFEVPS